MLRRRMDADRRRGLVILAALIMGAGEFILVLMFPYLSAAVMAVNSVTVAAITVLHRDRHAVARHPNSANRDGS